MIINSLISYEYSKGDYVTPTASTWAALHDAISADEVVIYDVIDGPSATTTIWTHPITLSRYQQIQRTVVCFDTSVLSGYYIRSASVNITKQNAGWSELTPAGKIAIVGFTGDDPESLDSYSKFGTTLFSAEVPLTDIIALGYYPDSMDIPLNATGLAAINKTGYTYIGIRLSADISNSPPNNGLDLMDTIWIGVGSLNINDYAAGFSIETSTNEVDWREIDRVDNSVISIGVSKVNNEVNSKITNYFRVKAFNVAGESGYSNTADCNCGDG